MPATVEIQEANGSPVSWTTIATARFCAADLYNPGDNYPVPIPNTGYRYSYWKTFCLNLSNIGTSISNIRFYCDGAIGWNYGSGGGLFIGIKNTGDNGIPVASYSQATGTEGLSGNWLAGSAGHAVYKGTGYSAANVTGFTISAPLLVDSTVYEDDGQSKCVVLQAKIDTAANGATQGIQTDETLYFRYDEI